MSVDKLRPSDFERTGGLLSVDSRCTRWRLRARKSSSASGYGFPHHRLTVTWRIPLKLYVPAGHRRPGAFPNHHVFLLSWGTGRYFGYALASCTGVISWLKSFDLDPVYDVSNRETFEALPRWYSELETYVSESVVKIIVGNKVDKVRRSPPPLHHLLNTLVGILPASINT